MQLKGGIHFIILLVIIIVYYRLVCQKAATI